MILYKVVKTRWSPNSWPPGNKGYYKRVQVDYRERKGDVTLAVNYAKKENASADKAMEIWGSRRDRYAVSVSIVEITEIGTLEGVISGLEEHPADQAG